MGTIHKISRQPTSEEAEKGAVLTERWTLVRDDSGHQYIIPLARFTEFNMWQEEDPESDEFNADLFNEFRFEGGLLTFKDPAVN